MEDVVHEQLKEVAQVAVFHLDGVREYGVCECFHFVSVLLVVFYFFLGDHVYVFNQMDARSGVQLAVQCNENFEKLQLVVSLVVDQKCLDLQQLFVELARTAFERSDEVQVFDLFDEQLGAIELQLHELQGAYHRKDIAFH